MKKTFTIDGQAVIILDEKGQVSNIQFLSDDEYKPVFEPGSRTNGMLQQFFNGSFDYVASKPRVRAHSDLIRKAAHGRLSGTRDNAWQLTLKVFASEAIDWQKAFVVEPIEVLTDLMGPERMREILKEQLAKL